MSNQPILAAEFTNGSKSRSPLLSITKIDRAAGTRTPVPGHEFFVTGKRDARAVAKRLGATPWNF